MKKIITILAIMFTTGAAFASTDNVVSKKALNAFNREFAGASDVTWYPSDEGTMVKFNLKDSKVTAHFSKAGELLATSRYITDAELPVNVITRLIKHFPDQNIRTIVEYIVEGESTYVITLENETEWTILKAQNGNPITTLKKLQKA